MLSFSLSKQHLQSLNDLRRNTCTNIVISKPDKGRATVVMHPFLSDDVFSPESDGEYD